MEINQDDEEWDFLTPRRKTMMWKYMGGGKSIVITPSLEMEKKIKSGQVKIGFKGFSDFEAPEEDSSGITAYRYTLNKAATKIWELCDGTYTIREILDVLTEVYDAPRSELKRDFKDFFQFCEEHNMVDTKWRSL